MLLVLAHFLALLAAPVGATISVLVLAKAAGRLIRWRSATDDSSWMVDLPMGGLLWQIGSAFVRALGAFGAARAVFALFAISPTLYVAAAVVLMLFAWDVLQLRFVHGPSLSPPAQVVACLRRKIAVGLVASSAPAVLFSHTLAT